MASWNGWDGNNTDTQTNEADLNYSLDREEPMPMRFRVRELPPMEMNANTNSTLEQMGQEAEYPQGYLNSASRKANDGGCVMLPVGFAAAAAVAAALTMALSSGALNGVFS